MSQDKIEVDIYQAEILEAVRTAIESASARRGKADDYFTTEELAESMEISVRRARRELKALKRAGLIEPGKTLRENLAGNIQTVTAYRLKQV